MKAIRLKTIRSKILAFLLLLIIIAMIVLSIISYQTSSNIINTEIDAKMNYKLDQTITTIQKSLYAHERIPESLARTVEVTGTQMSKEQYVTMLESYAAINDETLGTGVWFEPFKYKPGLKYFGPYAYKDNGKITYTDDYSTSQYDYPKYDWYKNGMSTDKSVIWSDPYYDDVSKITMVTATVPFYNKDKKFLGVTTGDINLSSLQKMIKEIKIGQTGRAFLLDKSGLYLADMDTAKIKIIIITIRFMRLCNDL
jgi:methyl-accepting chemotaxis protein